jgi:hypothetical protein
MAGISAGRDSDEEDEEVRINPRAAANRRRKKRAGSGRPEIFAAMILVENLASLAAIPIWMKIELYLFFNIIQISLQAINMLI